MDDIHKKKSSNSTSVDMDTVESCASKITTERNNITAATAIMLKTNTRMAEAWEGDDSTSVMQSVKNICDGLTNLDELLNDLVNSICEQAQRNMETSQNKMA